MPITFLGAVNYVIVRWAKKILVALGFSFVSYQAVATMISSITNLVVSHYVALPSAVYQLANYAGVWEAMSIVLTSLAASQVIQATKALKVWN